MTFHLFCAVYLCFIIICHPLFFFFFFFNDTATTEIYTLSLHDALPISLSRHKVPAAIRFVSALAVTPSGKLVRHDQDRKSTRLNSSHGYISYAVFCLKKKKKHNKPHELIRASVYQRRRVR